jgi:hypothetical protein
MFEMRYDVVPIMCRAGTYLKSEKVNPIDTSTRHASSIQGIEMLQGTHIEMGSLQNGEHEPLIEARSRPLDEHESSPTRWLVPNQELFGYVIMTISAMNFSASSL